MTEIKQEPIEDDCDTSALVNSDTSADIQEVLEVKDPLDIKLEPVIQQLSPVQHDLDLDNLTTEDTESIPQRFQKI